MEVDAFYSFTRCIDGIDVNRYGVMRTSALFRLLQEAADIHGALMHIGGDEMNALGVHWIVVRYQADIARIPRENETVTLETWTGAVRHMLYPRFYRILNADGETMVTASALWALADGKTRVMVGPDVTGVSLPAYPSDVSIPLPGRIRLPEVSPAAEMTIPYSYIDRNGHLNNTRYFDVAEDYIPEPSAGIVPKQIRMEYLNEAFQNEKMTISSVFKDGMRFVCGETEHPCFHAAFLY